MDSNTSEDIKKTMLIYLGICLGFIALSLLGLIWKDWEVVMSAGIGSVFGGLNLLFMVKSSYGVNGQDGYSSLKGFMGIGLIRFVFMAAAIVIPFVIIYFTMGAEINKLRYLNIIAAGVPFFVGAITIGIVNPGLLKGNGGQTNTK